MESSSIFKLIKLPPMKQIKEFVSDAWDFTGVSAYFYGVYTVAINRLGDVEINNILSNISLFVGIVWVSINIIDKLRKWNKKEEDTSGLSRWVRKGKPKT